MAASVVVARHTFWELVEAQNASAAKLFRSYSDSCLDPLRETKTVMAPTPTTASLCSDSDAESCSTMMLDSEDEVVPKWSLSSTRPSLVREKRTVGPWSRSNVVQAEPGCDAPTTLVLKRLPDGCAQQDVCEILTALGLHGKYDFLYAPTNFRTRSLFGYCFVNFSEHGGAMRAMEQLRGLVWERFDDARIEAYWSEPHQGLNVHLERYRNSPVMHRAVPRMYKPILLRNGVRIAFPKPTQRVMPPKDWSRQQSKC